jgi:hypothetical protein
VEHLQDLPLQLLHVLPPNVEERGRGGDKLDQRALGGHLARLGRAVAGFYRRAHVPRDLEARESVVGYRNLLHALLGRSVSLSLKAKMRIIFLTPPLQTKTTS